MPKMFVSRSETIACSVKKAFTEVRNFKGWPTWSPWLISDPDCKLTFAEDEYSWDGEVCGSGRMAVTGEVENKSITYDLSFFKPFKSQAQVKMLFVSEGDQAKVTWTMNSSLPFFLFWMRKSMEGFIGMDYERGLLMLKDLLETGSVPSKMTFHGKESVAGFTGIGKKNECSFDDIENQMGLDFERVREVAPTGQGFCVYYDFNVVKKNVSYLVGIQVDSVPEDLPSDFEKMEAPAMMVYAVSHEGPYRHLGNVWSAGMAHGRAKKFKHAKTFPPFELYEKEGDNPVVRVCLPMK